MKQIYKPQTKIKRTQRHIRWNWQRSPDNSELLRYHFIVVDDKNREQIMNKIIEPLTKYDVLNIIREKSVYIKNSKNNALFHSYDSPIKPSFLELHNINKPIVKDEELYERIRGTLDEYVENFFYPNN